VGVREFAVIDYVAASDVMAADAHRVVMLTRIALPPERRGDGQG